MPSTYFFPDAGPYVVGPVLTGSYVVTLEEVQSDGSAIVGARNFSEWSYWSRAELLGFTDVIFNCETKVKARGVLTLQFSDVSPSVVGYEYATCTFAQQEVEILDCFVNGEITWQAIGNANATDIIFPVEVETFLLVRAVMSTGEKTGFEIYREFLANTFYAGPTSIVVTQVGVDLKSLLCLVILFERPKMAANCHSVVSFAGH